MACWPTEEVVVRRDRSLQLRPPEMCSIKTSLIMMGVLKLFGESDLHRAPGDYHQSRILVRLMSLADITAFADEFADRK